MSRAAAVAELGSGAQPRTNSRNAQQYPEARLCWGISLGFGFSTFSRPGHNEDMERRLAAILAADVEGYSRLMGEDEARTLSALTA
jgi:class 3 adenylate cyclase